MSEKVLLYDLYLIRHGESYCNLDGYVPFSETDEFDPELTEKGLMQADKLGEYMKDKNFDDVYCSPLRRAVMTGAGLLKHKNQPLYDMPDLCEIGIPGFYNGFFPDELKKYYGGITFAPGYENSAKMTVDDDTPWKHEERYFERAERVLNYLSEKYVNGERVALVSHAGFLTYILFYLMGYRDAQPGYDFRLSNTGVCKVSFYVPGTNKYGDMIIQYVNDRRHLADV